MFSNDIRINDQIKTCTLHPNISLSPSILWKILIEFITLKIWKNSRMNLSIVLCFSWKILNYCINLLDIVRLFIYCIFIWQTCLFAAISPYVALVAACEGRAEENHKENDTCSKLCRRNQDMTHYCFILLGIT